MASPEINIFIPEASIAALTNQGYTLYMLKAVKSTANAEPLICYKTNQFLTRIQISWQDQYEGYSSDSQIMPHAIIDIGERITSALGNVIEIDSNGNLHNTTNGIAGAIGFLNNSIQQYTVGIAQSVEEFTAMQCASPILGTAHSRVIAPLDKVLLLFSTEQIEIGTVVTKAMASGVFIDLTGVQDRDIYYNVNDGWSADEEAWMQAVPAFTDLSTLLVEVLKL